MKRTVIVLVLSLLVFTLNMPAMAQDAKPVSKVLITNANILDSNKGTLAEGMSLLVEGNKIAKIARSVPAPGGATANNAELLSWSGPRNPYPGKLGVVEEGALADLLLVDGNPLENLELFEDPEKNLLVIMKDGVIYKNTL